MPSDPQAVLARHVEYGHDHRCHIDGNPMDCDAVLMARALAESEKRAELGDAWAAAEAALPEGFSFYGGASIEGYLFRAVRGSAPTESELRYSPTYNGSGPTPAAALRALAVALSEPETPR